MTDSPDSSNAGAPIQVTYGFVKDWFIDYLEKDCYATLESGKTTERKVRRFLGEVDILMTAWAQWMAENKFTVYAPPLSAEHLLAEQALLEQALLDAEDEDE